jgi:DNA anti-recombination protein RmuC
MATLAAATFWALTTNGDYTHYSGEHVPVLLLLVASYLALRLPDSVRWTSGTAWLAGFVLGAIPFAKLREENKALQSANCELRESQSTASISFDDLVSMRMKNVAQQKEAIDYYEKATKQHKADMKKVNEDCDKKMKKMDEDCDKKMKKMDEDCDKKMKKMKDDCDKKLEKMKEQISELTAKYDKIDKKQKKEIKKYQKQIKSMQSDSSDSDSD